MLNWLLNTLPIVKKKKIMKNKKKMCIVFSIYKTFLLEPGDEVAYIKFIEVL